MAGNREKGGRGAASEGSGRPDDREGREEAVAGLLEDFASLSPEAKEAFLRLARLAAEGRISPDGAGKGE